jgi:hypothetical protein
MREILNDLRIAMRRLRHSPGFVLVAVLSLTMAIAANLVVFGVMNAAILRPLNVANADSLKMIVQKPHGYVSQSYPDYRRSPHAKLDLHRYRCLSLQRSWG